MSHRPTTTAHQDLSTLLADFTTAVQRSAYLEQVGRQSDESDWMLTKMPSVMVEEITIPANEWAKAAADFTTTLHRLHFAGHPIGVSSPHPWCLRMWCHGNIFQIEKASVHQPSQAKVITLAWASRKRHIFIDGKMICQCDHKTRGGYSKKGGHYVSYQMEMPTYKKTPDSTYTHTDGVIPALPLDKIGGIFRKSICAICQKKYDSIFPA